MKKHGCVLFCLGEKLKPFGGFMPVLFLRASLGADPGRNAELVHIVAVGFWSLCSAAPRWTYRVHTVSSLTAALRSVYTYSRQWAGSAPVTNNSGPGALPRKRRTELGDGGRSQANRLTG